MEGTQLSKMAHVLPQEQARVGECTMGAEPGEGPGESSFRRLDTGTEQVALGDGGEGGCQSLGHQASSFRLRLGSWTDFEPSAQKTEPVPYCSSPADTAHSQA